MLAAAEIDYSQRDKVKALDEETYNRMKETCKNLFEMPEFDKRDTFWIHNKFIVDQDDLEKLCVFGLSVTLSKVRGLKYPIGEYDRPSLDLSFLGSTSGIGLMQIQSITWRENSCTEDIQDGLDHGWKILGICPPNDARRPTYIMGHAEKDKSW